MPNRPGIRYTLEGQHQTEDKAELTPSEAPWKRTELTGDAVVDHWPPHTDFLT